MPLRATTQQKRRNRVALAVTALLIAAGAAVLYSPLSNAAEPGQGRANGLRQASLRSAGQAGLSVKASSIRLSSTESADAAAADLAAAEEAAAEGLAASEEAAAADLAAAEAVAAAEVAAAEEQAAALAAAEAVAEEEVAAAEAAAPRPGPTPASLAACDSFACLRENQVPGAKYPFPHFVIIGFAKSATTSIADYLRYHPDVSYPTKKELHYFDEVCSASPPCDPAKERHYIRDMMRLPEVARKNFSVAAFDATPMYSRMVFGNDSLAPHLRAEMPWVRVVLSIRELISHAISWCHHLHKVSDDRTMRRCLIWMFKRAELGDLSRYQDLASLEKDDLYNYSQPVYKWLESFPVEQFHVIQYEELTAVETQPSVLQRLKTFLGLNVTAYHDYLPKSNARKVEGSCWPIPKSEYMQYLGYAQADAARLANFLQSKELADADVWMQIWKRVWDAHLASCKPDGICCIEPS